MIVNPKKVKKVVVVDPEAKPRPLDDRVYVCLMPKCENRGSVGEGAFHRDEKHPGWTICNGCGGDNNRWVREAAV
jgi:hypothetical protein